MVSDLTLPENMKRVIGPVRLVVEACLVLLLAVTVARICWLIVAPKHAVSQVDPRPLPALMRMNGQAVSADRSLLIHRNPFESDFVATIPDAPETQLNLRLAGVIMSTDPFGGSAQVTTPDNQTRRYVSGEEVLPGVVVERILSDRVILQRNGVSETLMLGGRGVGLMVIGDGSQAASTDTVPEGSPSRLPQSEGRVADAEALMSAISPVPMQREGNLYGYQLNARGSSDAMAAAGLAPGDILLEINGTSVRELAVNELIYEIGDSQVAVLQIERGGSVRTVRLGFDE